MGRSPPATAAAKTSEIATEAETEVLLWLLRVEYRYRVVSIKVVSPYDVAVLDPSGNEILTLVTCYPFYFVGSAPDRFIIRAERIT